MTAHDDYQVERMQPPEMPPCRCGHAFHLHEEFMCRWRDGEDFCLCGEYRPTDAEDLRQDEFPEDL